MDNNLEEKNGIYKKLTDEEREKKANEIREAYKEGLNKRMSDVTSSEDFIDVLKQDDGSKLIRILSDRTDSSIINDEIIRRSILDRNASSAKLKYTEIVSELSKVTREYVPCKKETLDQLLANNNVKYLRDMLTYDIKGLEKMFDEEIVLLSNEVYRLKKQKDLFKHVCLTLELDTKDHKIGAKELYEMLSNDNAYEKLLINNLIDIKESEISGLKDRLSNING